MDLIMYNKEHMRTWKDQGFRIELYDLNARQTDTGRNLIEYVIFDEKFSKKPIIGPIKVPIPVDVAIDADEVITACLLWDDDDFLLTSGLNWSESGRLQEMQQLRFEMSEEPVVYWSNYHSKEDQ